MSFSQATIDFNKELIFGEIGSFIGAAILSYSSTALNFTPNMISLSAVVGSISGSTIFFLSMRVYDKTRKNDFTTRKFAEDLAYFTPAAFVIACLSYYPIIFFMSRYFIENQIYGLISVVASQLVGFIVVLILLNVYREILIKTIRKTL
ncbi:Uncharacterised protein [uncultured archaeon]|nr:Uncharacterised protein [uncultured archaeon]